MKVRLVMERKRKRVWTTELRGSEATLGRALGSTIRIPSSDVSRLHCRLRVENGGVTVEDMESVNGTFLNGERIHGIETVQPGDRLTIGPATFVVEYELVAEPLEELEAAEEVEMVGELFERPTISLPKEALPLAEPLEEVEEASGEEADVFLLDENDVMNLPEGGDLRDFLSDLDDTEDRSKKRKG